MISIFVTSRTVMMAVPDHGQRLCPQKSQFFFQFLFLKSLLSLSEKGKVKRQNLRKHNQSV